MLQEKYCVNTLFCTNHDAMPLVDHGHNSKQRNTTRAEVCQQTADFWQTACRAPKQKGVFVIRVVSTDR
jgi:hypothetical protein